MSICKVCPLRNGCKLEIGSCGLGREGYWAPSPDRGTISSYRKEGDCWRELGIVAVGEWKYEAERISPFRATFKWRDGLRAWRNVETGEVAFRVREGFFKEFDHIPEGWSDREDVCCYCGASNGPQGEYRMGFDCCQCGCN